MYRDCHCSQMWFCLACFGLCCKPFKQKLTKPGRSETAIVLFGGWHFLNSDIFSYWDKSYWTQSIKYVDSLFNPNVKYFKCSQNPTFLPGRKLFIT